MCRRRFFKSYLYIEYGGIKYKNGETVSVSPFIAEGNSTTIVLDSARPWIITNSISWLTVNNSSNKSGTYTITLTAAANQTYDGRSGSFTAKTLDDRYSIVVSVSQEPKASENYIYVTPQQITLDAEDTYDALNCDFYHNGQSPVPVTPVWSTESDVISISADGVVTSNNQTAQEFNNIEVWAKYIYEGDELWDSMKVNVRAAEIQRFITVEPQSVSMGATGTQQLTVTYHEIINGHETTTDVTNPSNYSSNSQVITVNGTGLISANNQSEDPATATIIVTYDSVPSVNVPVTANSASVEYRNLRVEPSEMTLGSGDVENGKLVHAYVDEYINGQPTGVIVEVTSAATWNSNHTDVATVSQTGNNETIKPVYGSGYFPDERNATITGSYLGMTDTCEVTVEPEGYVEKYITVTPSTTSITSTGVVQLVVKLITKTDGVITGEETVTNDASYDENSPLINVNSTGYVSATGSETGGTAIVTVSYPGVDDVQATIIVQGASVDEYLEITPASTSTTWNGQVTYEVFYVREVNGQKTSTKITDANVLRFDLSVGTVGDMNGFVFEAENISTAYTDEEISVTCTAGTYNGLSTRTPAELRVNGASSVVYRLDVEAVPSTIAYSGSSQLRASAVTVVNGNVHDWYVPSDVVWSENSTALTINGSTATGTHTGTGATNVTVTGTSQSFGQSGTATIRINGRPEGKLTISKVGSASVTSGAGSCNFTVAWAYLKPETTITLADSNLDSFSPTSISITNANYTGGSVTVSADYSENPYTQQRELYLRGTATTYYDQTKTDYDYYVQDGAYAPSITYELVVAPTAVTLDYGETTALSVTYYVVTDGQRDAGTDVSTTATYTNTGSNSNAITINSQKVIAGANTGNTDKDVTITISYGLAAPVDAVITSKKKLNVKLDVQTDSEWHLGSGAGSCDYYIEWENLKPGTRITLDDDNLTSYSPTYISITSSNYTGGSATITADYGANPDTSARRLYLYATGTSRYDGDSPLDDDDYYEQAAKYTPSITHDLVVTPNLTTESYSGTNQYTATYITLVDGVRDTSQDVDVTDSAVWSIENTGGVFTVLEVDEGYAEWVNLSTGGTAPTVRVRATYNGYSDYDDFTVSRLNSLTATLEVLPATTSVTYNDAVIYTLVLTIKHNGTTVYTKTIDGTSASDSRFTITADTALYYKSNETQFLNQNTGNTDVTATVTATFEESSALYLPDGTVVEGTATAELLKEVVLTGWIRWDKKSENIKNNGEFEDVASISWGNLDTNYPIVISSTYLDPDPTNIPNTASTGGYGKSEMCDLISFSGNTGGVRTVIVSASCYDLAGNLVYDVLTTQQNGGYSPTYHVWIASNTNSASFENDSDSAITIEGFSVFIDNTLDFDVTASSRVINANSTRSLTGSLTGYSGTSSYQITVSWRGDYHNDNTTTIYWDETVNGVTYHRYYTLDSFETSTDINYITGDTELSNFVVEMKQVEPDTPPSGETWITFTDEPIIFRNDCNQPIYCQSVDLKLNVGGTLYSLTYANDYASELVPIGSTINLFPLGTIPDKIKKTENISASISYVYIHVTSREGTGIPIAADEEAGFVGNGIGGNDFEVYISGSDAGQMIFDGYEGLGSVTPGHNGYIFNPDGEVTCFVQHNF